MRKGLTNRRSIPIAGPWITQKEIDRVTEAVQSAWYENANLYNERFESSFAQHVGRKHAISLPSCTAAIHLSLAALNLKPADEVIIPEITWIASSAPISYVGATPVFADIDPESWCLSPASFEKSISPHTKAVLAVDVYGNMPEMKSILAIARKHDIAVIEDAAEAIGSEYHGRPAGNFGLASAFSFHGSKTLTTGEGGMLVTDDEALHQRCLYLRDHARAPGDQSFFNTEVAYKYKMSSMQAALGLAQLERINELVDRKCQIFSWYEEHLKDVDGIRLNSEGAGTKNSYWMITVVWDAARNLKKEKMIDALQAKGIECRPFFHPLSSLPAYQHHDTAGAARSNNRTAYDISPRAMNLPSALCLEPDDVAFVCSEFKRLLGQGKKLASLSPR
jgi:perosamine synthetase